MTMTRIEITDLDKNLIADLEGSTAGFEAFEADDPEATVSNQAYHIVFSADARRGGIVFVGSGSSGATSWTDAATAQEALDRYLADDMIN